MVRSSLTVVTWERCSVQIDRIGGQSSAGLSQTLTTSSKPKLNYPGITSSAVPSASTSANIGSVWSVGRGVSRGNACFSVPSRPSQTCNVLSLSTNTTSTKPSRSRSSTVAPLDRVVTFLLHLTVPSRPSSTSKRSDPSMFGKSMSAYPSASTSAIEIGAVLNPNGRATSQGSPAGVNRSVPSWFQATTLPRLSGSEPPPRVRTSSG